LNITGDSAAEVGSADLMLAGAPDPVPVKYLVLLKETPAGWRWDVDIWNLSV
jgi:hypothetical protein